MSDHVDIATYHFGNSNNPCLIMLPGLTGTVESYLSIINNAYLQQHFYIVFMDYRAHLDKAKNISHGMNIARLSCDLYEVIQQFKCTKVTLLGHSIGCGVIWSYIELYNQYQLKKFDFTRPITIHHVSLLSSR